MKRMLLTLVALVSVGTITVMAQPPGGPGGGGPRGSGGPGHDQHEHGDHEHGHEGRGHGGPGHEAKPPANPLVEALDLDGDHVISASEIASAAQSLGKLDKNADGQLDHNEIHPPQHRGNHDQHGGPPVREERERGERGERGERDGNRGRDGGDRNGPRGGPHDRSHGGGEMGDEGPGGRRGPGGPGGQEGGPQVDQQQMLSHAMGFDQDKDGMLNETELKAFIAELATKRHGQGQMRRGRDGAGGRDRESGRGRSAETGGRPSRPSRPE